MINYISNVESFLEVMLSERGASKNTVESYRRDLEQFCTYLIQKRIGVVNLEDIRGWISFISKDFATASVARKISAIKQFFGYLYSEKLIDQDPSRLVELPKKSKSLPKFLTIEEIKRIEDEILKDTNSRGLRAHAILKILSGSGLRVSEIISLKRNSIQSTTIEDKKRYFLLVKGKGDKERISPVSDVALAGINRYLEVIDDFIPKSKGSNLKAAKSHHDNWLFPSNKSKEGHITRQQVANILKIYAINAGVDTPEDFPTYFAPFFCHKYTSERYRSKNITRNSRS